MPLSSPGRRVDRGSKRRGAPGRAARAAAPPPREARHRAPARLRASAGRAVARWERPAEPRDVRDDVDAGTRGSADGRHGRQEHDRQGRVPADRGDRGALREHPQRPVERAGGLDADRLLDHRLERGGDARRHGAQVALARPPQGRGQAARSPEPGDGSERPDLLGEVLPLLGGGAQDRADGGRALSPHRRRGRRPLRREHDRRRRDPRLDLRRLLRAGQGDRRGARSPPAGEGDRRADPRRRRVGRVRRAVHPARPRVGLPDRPRAVDQRLGAQVRARLPGRRLGHLARRGGAPEGPRVRRQLPGRQHADVRAQLRARAAR